MSRPVSSSDSRSSVVAVKSDDVGEEHGQLLAVRGDLDVALAGENRRIDLGRQVLRQLRRQDLQRPVLFAHELVRQLRLALGLAKFLFGPLDLGDVRVDGDGAALCGLALVDLDPAAVGAALDVGLARLPVLCQPLGNPLLDPSFGVLDKTLLRRVADEHLVRRARRRRAQPGIEKLAIGAVADDQPVLRVVQRKPLRDRFDRVGQALLAAPEGDLRLLARGDVAPRADHLDRLAVLVADQVLLVVHPAVAAVLLEKPVLDRVAALS